MSSNILEERAVKRFLKYVSFNTQSDEASETCPSTAGQLELGRYLVAELRGLGLINVCQDDNGYVYGTLPASEGLEDATVLAYICHMDVSPDCPADNIKAVFSEENGGTVIRSDGGTLLGADDKAGMAEIVSALERLAEDKGIRHGEIRFIATPDEEIGRGTDRIDMELVKADCAYTVDGSEAGELEYECFNAAGARVTFTGESIHLGYAYGRLKNACLMAAEFMGKLPENERPETTKDREGYIHVGDISGNVEHAEINLVIRDFDRDGLERRKEIIRQAGRSVEEEYGPGSCSIEIKDGYCNMKEHIVPENEYLLDNVRKVYKGLGIECIEHPIRGGTDGAVLSGLGLPCPNLGTGAVDFHGRNEHIAAEDILIVTEVLVRLAVATVQ